MDNNKEKFMDRGSRPPGIAMAVFSAVATVLAAFFYMKINYSGGAQYQYFLDFFRAEILNTLRMIEPVGILRLCGYGMAALLYILSQFIFGREINRRLSISIDEPFQVILAGIASGTGVFSIVVLLLGLIGALHKPILVLIIVFPLAYALVTRDGRAALLEIPVAVFKRKYSGYDLFLVVMIFLFMVTGLVGSMSPPDDTDALTYHLAVPKLYLEAGRIFHVTHIVQSNWPFATEMHYLAAMGASGVISARIINFIFVAMAALAAGVLARVIGGPKRTLIAIAVFLSVPVAQGHYFLSNVEPALCFYTLAAVIFLIRYRSSGMNGDLVACALFSGFAAATKYTGAAYTVLVWMFVVILSSRNRRYIHGFLLFPAIAAVPVLPWLIKNVVWTGNPIWPFLYSVFGGAYWTEYHSRDYMFYATHFFGDTGVAATLKSLALTVKDSWNRNPGLPLVSLLPFMVMSGRTLVNGLIPGAVACAMIVLWGITSPQTRFLLPAFAIICALAVAAIPERGRFIRALIAMALAFQLVIFVTAAMRHVPYSVGGDRSEINQNDPLNEVYDFVDRNTAHDARLLLLWDSRGLNSPRDYVVGDAISQAYIDFTKYANTVELLKKLYSEKITHVIVCTRTVADAVKLDGMIRQEYELEPSDPTTIYYLAQHQRNAIEHDFWKEVFESSDGYYKLFEIDYSAFLIKR